MTSTCVSVSGAVAYLRAYILAYREEYSHFVDSPPQGGGYPPLWTSPYLDSRKIECWIARDGFAIADLTWEPAYRWDIAGGPAMVTDFPETRVPEPIVRLLKEKGILGQNIGLYRIVAQNGIRDEVWTGSLPDPVEVSEGFVGETRVVVRCLDINWDDLVQRLTFGAYGLILDPRLPQTSDPFWRPHVVRDFGFLPADRNSKRFFRYLELSPHVDLAAWDLRTVPVRVRVDVRRDFARTFAMGKSSGGTMQIGDQAQWSEHFNERVSRLARVIEEFQTMLTATPDVDELVVHDFLKQNPALLDVYGDVQSKPRFDYPPDESPLGKTYVEPDFVVTYPGRTYRLIEIERPSKRVATKRGEPRSSVTQAAFQIAEWRTYIQKHYERIKDDFPGIAMSYSTTLVIGRDVPESFGADRTITDYKELLGNQYAVDEVLTYDDLLARATSALARLTALPHAP